MKEDEELLNETVEANGKYYYFDIEKIYEIVFSDDKINKEREIVDSYDLSDEEDASLKLSNKMVREISVPQLESVSTIKYDLIKLFIMQLISAEDITVPGCQLIVNTLIEKGILVEKQVIENEDE